MLFAQPQTSVETRPDLSKASATSPTAIYSLPRRTSYSSLPSSTGIRRRQRRKCEEEKTSTGASTAILLVQSESGTELSSKLNTRNKVSSGLEEKKKEKETEQEQLERRIYTKGDRKHVTMWWKKETEGQVREGETERLQNTVNKAGLSDCESQAAEDDQATPGRIGKKERSTDSGDSTHPVATAMKPGKKQKTSFNSSLTAFLVLACVALTYHSFLVLRNHEARPYLEVVWASGWVTCASTGLGAVPFFIVNTVGERSVAFSNAIAAGMMFSASLGLVLEGATARTQDWCLDSSAKVLVGLWSGVGFIKLTERYFGDFDQMSELGSLGQFTTGSVLDVRRLLLIFAVMTLHSFAEGVGLGVSFQSESLGSYITTTLAIHNVPEGLALSIVLIPRNVSRVATVLICIFSSLPQPIMAVPAYLFVDYFKMIVPIGLGFAAGAMLYVAIFELFTEAQQVLKSGPTFVVAFCSSVVMILMQACISN